MFSCWHGKWFIYYECIHLITNRTILKENCKCVKYIICLKKLTNSQGFFHHQCTYVYLRWMFFSNIGRENEIIVFYWFNKKKKIITPLVLRRITRWWESRVYLPFEIIVTIEHFIYRGLVEFTAGLRHGEMPTDQRGRLQVDYGRVQRHVRETSCVQMRLGLSNVWRQFDRVLSGFHVVASNTYVHR